MELDFFLDWSLFLLMFTCFSFTDVIGGVELVHHLLLSFIIFFNCSRMIVASLS